jgi:hypothetical protein
MIFAHPDFTDDIEIRSIGLDHEKFAHDRRLKNNVGDVEIAGNHHQVRAVTVFHNVLQNAFIIQFGLTVGYDARRQQILNDRRATKRKLAGVDATAIGAGQNFPDRNAVSAEGFSDAPGLLYTAGRKVYFRRAVAGRKPPYSFPDVDVRVAQQDDFAALPQCSPDLLVVSNCAAGRKRQQDQTEEQAGRPAVQAGKHGSPMDPANLRSGFGTRQ